MYSLAPSVYLSTDLPPFHVYKSCCDWLSGAAGRACSPLLYKRTAVTGCLAQKVVPVHQPYKRAAVIGWLVQVGPAVIS